MQYNGKTCAAFGTEHQMDCDMLYGPMGYKCCVQCGPCGQAGDLCAAEPPSPPPPACVEDVIYGSTCAAFGAEHQMDCSILYGAMDYKCCLQCDLCGQAGDLCAAPAGEEAPTDLHFDPLPPPAASAGPPPDPSPGPSARRRRL